MDDTYNIKVFIKGKDHLLENVRASRYTHTRLLNAVMQLLIDDGHDVMNLAFNMIAYVDDSMDQIEILNDKDVETMFARNRKYMELELHVETLEAVPVAIDTSSKKKNKKVSVSGVDETYQPEVRSSEGYTEWVFKGYGERCRMYRNRKCKQPDPFYTPPPPPPKTNSSRGPHFVDLTEDSDGENIETHPTPPPENTQTQTSPTPTPENTQTDPTQPPENTQTDPSETELPPSPLHESQFPPSPPHTQETQSSPPSPQTDPNEPRAPSPPKNTTSQIPSPEPYIPEAVDEDEAPPMFDSQILDEEIDNFNLDEFLSQTFPGSFDTTAGPSNPPPSPPQQTDQTPQNQHEVEVDVELDCEQIGRAHV